MGLPWHRTPGDIRIEVHPLIAGAHVVVQPFEILDLVAGFLFLDPKDDDF